MVRFSSFAFLFLIAGCYQQPANLPNQQPAKNAAVEIDFDEFKAADPQIDRLEKVFPGYQWSWSVTNQSLWSNYQCNGQDENETFQAFIMGFKLRECQLTEALAPTVQELIQEWMKSDRKNFAERSHMGWVISITGGNDNGFFLRAAIKQE